MPLPVAGELLAEGALIKRVVSIAGIEARVFNDMV